jgi:large subunit ribosomal protein L25
MPDNIELKVDKRQITGKKVRFLRNEGKIPVHLFGHNIDSLSLQGNATDLQKVIVQAGKTKLIELKIGKAQKTHNVMVREVQRDTIRGNLLHIDLYEVNMAEKIRVEVPIILVGESPALRIRENMLSQEMNSLTIECLPDKMPNKIEVDVSVITEADQAIRVKDMKLSDVEILNEPDLVIAKVSIRPVEVVEEAKPAAAVEGAAAAAPSEGEAKGETKTESKTGAAKAEAKAEKK